jgi:hypothetical protein
MRVPIAVIKASVTDKNSVNSRDKTIELARARFIATVIANIYSNAIATATTTTRGLTITSSHSANNNNEYGNTKMHLQWQQQQ